MRGFPVVMRTVALPVVLLVVLAGASCLLPAVSALEPGRFPALDRAVAGRLRVVDLVEQAGTDDALLAGAAEGLAWNSVVYHSHTQYSDGNLTVQWLMLYAALSGVDAIAITDHRTLDQCRDPYFRETLGTWPIRGEEWGWDGHAGILGLSGDEPIPNDSIDLMLAEAAERGGLVVINHPFGSGDPWPRDYLDEGIGAIEVWNTIWLTPFLTEGLTPGLPASGDLDGLDLAAPYLAAGMGDELPNPRAVAWWQGFLAEGRRIPAIGGVDFHYFPLPLWLPVCLVAAPDNTPEEILAATANGRLVIARDPTSPRVFISADADGDGVFEALTGDDITVTEPGEIRFLVEVEGGAGRLLRLWTAEGQLADVIIGPGRPWRLLLTADVDATTQDFLRAEVHSPVLDLIMLGLTNPIYVNYEATRD
jgi:hypothetical protein